MLSAQFCRTLDNSQGDDSFDNECIWSTASSESSSKPWQEHQDKTEVERRGEVKCETDAFASN